MKEAPGARPVRAQASIELAMSLIVCLILILGVSRLFVWINGSLVKRQEAFQDTRDEVGNGDTIEEKYNTDFYDPSKDENRLDILR
ncbi:hypothetical protein EPN16_03215 [bacterium]|nr:MAG: hypothetical protein EPN16_03215 [bacterium]